ncbi:S-formylglutathione hydrolase [Cupriavidus numazuensis]|uniref:S-formylglutathione hydrolase n=3 Tax=Cupriavidus numazuensis TaxID=221992 RepID=A0ABN7Q1E8_9BURK|nr:S-formylglutathione hydrolase [Cupriavidus numazuensis]CAG2139735.1 S-formylglutathione hydrolase FrmB [Cupriavidus numazuensis]
MTLELLSEHGCHGGVQRFYRHASTVIGLPMRFSVYLPPQALAGGGKLPTLFYLAGLTCTEETFMIKAGAQRFAAEHGLVLIAPDTSPRGAGVPGEADAWDFGVGAGFYVDATEAPWSQHWRMESYVTQELFDLVSRELPVDPDRVGIFGHSMGGHGALVLAQRHPQRFRSVSAFAPIAAPTQCPWGRKAFTGYLGADRAAWMDYDASALMSRQTRPPFPEGILVDQGLSDEFLEAQLNPAAFEAACASVGQPLILRRHEAYDHGYYFISTFIGDHIHFHASILAGRSRPMLTRTSTVR